MIDGEKAIMASEELYQITSNYFCCGIVAKNNIVVNCASIVFKYLIGRSIISVKNYCELKNWKIEKIK